MIVREVDPRGRVRYALTERGRELRAVVQVLGEWGARWLELEPHHSDPAYVLFATSRLVDVERAPAHGLVVRFELGDRHYWLLVRRPRAEVCTSYPGRAEDLVVRTRSEVLARCHLRHTTFAQAERVASWRSTAPGPSCGRSWTASGRARSPSRRERVRSPPDTAAQHQRQRGGGVSEVA